MSRLKQCGPLYSKQDLQSCSTQFTPLEKRHHAAAIGLLDGICHEYLQRLCPSFLSCISLPWRFQHLNILRLFLLANSITTTSLDLFCRSFLDTLPRFGTPKNWITFALLFVRVGLNLQVACNTYYLWWIIYMTELLLVWVCDYHKKAVWYLVHQFRSGVWPYKTTIHILNLCVAKICINQACTVEVQGPLSQLSLLVHESQHHTLLKCV